MEKLPSAKINKILSLREKGYSVPEIRRLTGHGSGTVLRYIRDVKIQPEFLEKLRAKQNTSTFRMLEEQKRAKDRIQQLVTEVRTREKIIIAAGCLYWAEGAKKDLSL